MSYLLDKVSKDYKKKSISILSIYDRWKDSGLIDELDKEEKVRMSIALEIASLKILFDNDVIDIHYKMMNKDYYNQQNERFEVVIFPIVRRIVNRYEEAINNIPLIVNMARKEYNSYICKALYSEKQSAIAYFYDVLLPASGDSYHTEREIKTYDEVKKKWYKIYVERGVNKNYEEFVPFDVEAEYCVYVSLIIENKLRQIDNEKI